MSESLMLLGLLSDDRRGQLRRESLESVSGELVMNLPTAVGGAEG
jgi:hypothetical protein